MKKLLAWLISLAFVCTLMTACQVTGNAASTTTPTAADNTVGMTATAFAQSSITIKKGESIRLLNQSNTSHVIANGFWSGNIPDPIAEKEAPFANNIIFSTNEQNRKIGPFNAVGKFRYYCSIHPDMNLIVIVQ